jgi:hypothetical protein
LADLAIRQVEGRTWARVNATIMELVSGWH